MPDDYEEMLSFYTRHGFRVIALAGKSMPGLTWIKAQRLKRCAQVPFYIPATDSRFASAGRS